MNVATELHPDAVLNFSEQIQRLNSENTSSKLVMAVSAVAGIAITGIAITFAVTPGYSAWIVVPIELISSIAVDALIQRVFLKAFRQIQERNVEKESYILLDKATNDYLEQWGTVEDAFSELEGLAIPFDKWNALNINDDDKKMCIARLLAFMSNADSKAHKCSQDLLKVRGEMDKLLNPPEGRKPYHDLSEKWKERKRSKYEKLQEEANLHKHTKTVWRLYHAYYFSLLCDPTVTKKIDDCLSPRNLSAHEIETEKSLNGTSPFLEEMHEYKIPKEFLQEDTILRSTPESLKENIFDYVFGQREAV